MSAKRARQRPAAVRARGRRRAVRAPAGRHARARRGLRAGQRGYRREVHDQKKRGVQRRRDLSKLPLPKIVERYPVPADATCGRCGGALRSLGEAVSHRVDRVPGHLVVKEVRREKCTCPACLQEGVLAAQTPYFLPKAMCGDALLVRLLVAKFGDHLPLNRQAAQLAREGFEVDTSVTAGCWPGMRWPSGYS